MTRTRETAERVWTMAIHYGRIDVDGIGSRLEDLLRAEDVVGADRYQRVVQGALDAVAAALIEHLHAEILYRGCDDILFRIPAETDFRAIEPICRRFLDETGCTVSVGLGPTVGTAVRNLYVAKSRGKARIVGTEPGQELAW